MTVNLQESQSRSSTDRIEKKLVLRASRARVWRALSNAEEFATWFGVKLDGAFAEGATLRGDVTHSNGSHICTIDMRIERMEAERYFSYRWHPYPIDPAVDYSVEPTTLVEFTLDEVEGGTSVTIVESGFDAIPLARRAEAFRMNDQGWGGQINNLARYVE
jgi:uncharacterized protein YndB with AHSA1/START domain